MNSKELEWVKAAQLELEHKLEPAKAAAIAASRKPARICYFAVVVERRLEGYQRLTSKIGNPTSRLNRVGSPDRQRPCWREVCCGSVSGNRSVSAPMYSAVLAISDISSGIASAPASQFPHPFEAPVLTLHTRIQSVAPRAGALKTHS